jgi:hypothetical protein
MDQGCCFGYGFCQKRLNEFWTVLPMGHTIEVSCQQEDTKVIYTTEIIRHCILFLSAKQMHCNVLQLLALLLLL